MEINFLKVWKWIPRFFVRGVDFHPPQPSERRSTNFEADEVDIARKRRQEMSGIATGGAERQMGSEISRSEEETWRRGQITEREIKRTSLSTSSSKATLHNEWIHNIHSAGEDEFEWFSSHIYGSAAERRASESQIIWEAYIPIGR